MKILKFQPTVQDTAVGVAIGFAGGALMNKLKTPGTDGKTILPESIVKSLNENPMLVPILGAALGGGIAYLVQRKKSPQRAMSHLVGAVLGGATLSAYAKLKAEYPEHFGDVVSLHYGLPGGYSGFPVDNPQQGLSDYGVLTDRPMTPALSGSTSNPTLNELAAYSMQDVDYDGFGIVSPSES